jgi:hypothetical protein
VPAALAAAYVAGFLTSQTLEALRPGAAPAGVAVEAPEVALPSVSAAPPSQVESAAAPPPAAEIQEPDAFTPPPPPPPLPAAAPTPPAMAAPTGDSAEAAAPSPAEPVAPEAAATEPATASEVAPRSVSAAPSPAPVRRPPPQRTSVEVSVEAEPGASILINGEPVGSGTVKGLELAPGPHMLEVRLADGRVVQRVIDVKGTRYDVKVR